MENKVKTQQEIEQEIAELNEQFGAFLRTKGITAKFKLAFSDMAESAKAQHEADKANFDAVKAQSAEENKEFVEFLHTKGLKAKITLVVENIKKGAAQSREKTAAQIAQAKASAHANVANADYGAQNYSADQLSAEFNAFLKAKGLDGKYTVVVTEE